jgi:uncharacterized delta-60 repeat protein
MRSVFFKAVWCEILAWFGSSIMVAAPGPGNLDSSFGGTGMVQLGFGRAYDFGQAVALQSDGKIVVGGVREDTGQVLLLRLGTNNLPDPTFGSGGVAAVTPPHTPSVEPFALQPELAVAVQPDGKIVVAGSMFAQSGFTENPDRDFLLLRFKPDGSLDSSFGNNGIVSRDFGYDDICSAMVLQSDGKIVTAGTGTTYIGGFPANLYALLARFDTNGNPDLSFGSGGAVVQTNESAAYALALDGDGNIFLGGYLSGAGGGNGVFRFTADGALDTSFGASGRVIISGAGRISAVAIQPGGILVSQPEMILAAGIGSGNAVVARMSLSGALDTSFNGTGVVSHRITSGSPIITGLASVISAFFPRRVIKIVISGYDYNSSDGFMAARFNNDGSLDTTFGNGGVVLTPLSGSGYDKAYGLAIQSGARILLAGTSQLEPCESDFALVSYNWSDGSLNTNFNGTGILVTDVGNRQAEAKTTAVQSDGKMVAAGYFVTGCGNGNGVALCRFNPDGTLDPGFGSGGKVTATIGPGSSEADAMIIQPDGKIVIAGNAEDGNNYSSMVARFLANGALDNSFGTGGSVITLSGTNGSSANALALQPDGKILVGAQVSVNANDMAIIRYNPDGSLDTNWNGTGKVFTAIGSQRDQLSAVAVQTDGKVIGAGYSSFAGSDKFMMFRCNTNGTLDSTFGSFGRVVTQVGSAGVDLAYAMAFQPDRKIILAGLSFAGTFPTYEGYVAVVRYNPDGTLDAGFGSNGKTTIAIGFASDYAQAVAVQSDGKIVTGCRSQNGPLYKFAVARFSSNGTLDSGYGLGGVNHFDFGSGADENANGMAMDSLGRITMVGGAGNVFGILRVTSDPFLRINSITHLANGHMALAGIGVPDGSHTLLKATTLNGSNFNALAPVSADASGNWQYEDATALSDAVRFYRLSFP